MSETSSGLDAAPPGESPELPEIILRTAESEVIDEAIAALDKEPTLYQSGPRLAHVVHDRAPTAKVGPRRDPAAPRIVAVPGARLRELLTKNARLVTVRPKKSKTDATDATAIEWVTKPAHPADWLVKGIEARGQWPGIRQLRGVIETPALRPDGTILDVTGYDAVTGLLYQPTADYPAIPERPTKADAQTAVAELIEVVKNFPFAKLEHQAAWLAAVLTPLARPAIDGPAPMILVDATTAGSGKGLLADCIALITTGRDATKTPYPGKEVETEKLITSFALEGDPVVTFDNVTGTLGGPSLDLALTSTTWRARILGFSATTGRVPLAITWLATANNCELGPDTSRRTLHIRLEPGVESPELRDGFAHPDLLAWVRQERPRLVAAALTILRAYVVAGRPAEKLPPWGSFEAWSDLVRQAVVWTGQPDPGATRQELRRGADRERSLLRSLMTGWLELDRHCRGFKVGEALAAVAEQRRERARDPSAPRLYPALEAALAEMAPRGLELPGARTLGMRLSKCRGRVIDGLAFDSLDDHGTALWRVSEVGEAGCSSGSSCSPQRPSRGRILEEVEET